MGQALETEPAAMQAEAETGVAIAVVTGVATGAENGAVAGSGAVAVEGDSFARSCESSERQ
eukprot:3134808-Amphidinium_carterae.1